MPILSLLAALVSLVFLAGLMILLDPAAIIATFADISIWHLLIGLLLVQVQILLSAWRWRFTAGRLGQYLPISVAVREYYVSSLLNQCLPGGMAGDAVRAYRGRAPDKGNWKQSAKAVVFERLSGQAIFLAFSATGILCWPLLLTEPLPAGLNRTLLFVSGLLAIVAVGIIIISRTRISRKLENIRSDLADVFWHSGAFPVQFACSVVIVASYVASFMLASEAVGASLPPLAAITVIPLCLLTMLIPASVGGWGTREAAAALLWPILGFSATQGVSASLLYGALSFAGALPGMLFLLLSGYHGRIDRAT